MAEVIVPYTDSELTLAALKVAADLTAPGDITLLAVHVVPRPLDLHHSAVDEGTLLHRLEELVARSGVWAKIELVFARSRRQSFGWAIVPGALVVIATRRRWWPTAEERLARALRRRGHRVAVFIHPAPHEPIAFRSKACWTS